MLTTCHQQKKNKIKSKAAFLTSPFPPYLYYFCLKHKFSFRHLCFQKPRRALRRGGRDGKTKGKVWQSWGNASTAFSSCRQDLTFQHFGIFGILAVALGLSGCKAQVRVQGGWGRLSPPSTPSPPANDPSVLNHTPGGAGVAVERGKLICRKSYLLSQP